MKWNEIRQSMFTPLPFPLPQPYLLQINCARFGIVWNWINGTFTIKTGNKFAPKTSFIWFTLMLNFNYAHVQNIRICMLQCYTYIRGNGNLIFHKQILYVFKWKHVILLQIVWIEYIPVFCCVFICAVFYMNNNCVHGTNSCHQICIYYRKLANYYCNWLYTTINLKIIFIHSIFLVTWMKLKNVPRTNNTHLFFPN